MLGPVRAAQLRRAKWWRLNNIDGEVIAWCFTIAIWGAAVIDTHVLKPKVVEYVTPQIAEAYVEPREVRIEVRVNWTEERIEQEIRSVFHEDPDIAVRIAKCESGLRIDAKGPTQDYGLMQIHAPFWDAVARELGYHNYRTEVQDNLKMARYIYDNAGKKWTDWVCYNKKMY